MIINKRKNIDINYNWFPSNYESDIDKYVVRHAKFIKKQFGNNCLNEISQKMSDYNDDQKMIIDYNSLLDEDNDNYININNIYDSIESIKNLINDSINESINDFKDNINSEFTANEQSEIDSLLSNQISYVRFGINPDTEHTYFVTKLYETTITDYFNRFDESNTDYQNKLLEHKGGEYLNQQLSPMYNDLIYYSNPKYEYVNNAFKNLNNENNE